MKKLFENKKILIGLGVAVVVIALSIGGFIYFNNHKNVSETMQTDIVFKINPELKLSFNDNKRVVDLQQLNEDAKIFVKNEFIGLSIEEATKKIIEIAHKKGYLVEDNSQLTLDFVSGDIQYLGLVQTSVEEKDILVKSIVHTEYDKERLRGLYPDLNTTLEEEKEQCERRAKELETIDPEAKITCSATINSEPIEDEYKKECNRLREAEIQDLLNQGYVKNTNQVPSPGAADQSDDWYCKDEIINGKKYPASSCASVRSCK